MLSNLQQKLENKEFVITAEIFPPKGVDVSSLIEKANILRDYVTAINVTDGQRAVMRISPLAVSKILVDIDVEPIFQLTCRDRNRIALEADILGAYALGIRNILLISGDYPTSGDHKDAKPVYDLDTIQLIKTVKTLETGVDLVGKKLKGSPKFFKGAALNPFSTPHSLVLQTLQKKIEAGAEFFQTQPIFDMCFFDDIIHNTKGFDTNIIVGVFLLKSYEFAQRIARIPGICISKTVLDRLKNAKDELDEGINIAAELVKEFRRKAQGVHIMAIACEEHIPEIIKRSK